MTQKQNSNRQVIKANDIAGRAITEGKLNNVKWMLLSRIKRGETLKLEEFNKRLIALLRLRAVELEQAEELEPGTVTDWMALALFAEDRDRLSDRCERAEKEKDPNYKNAAYWLRRLMVQRRRRENDTPENET